MHRENYGSILIHLYKYIYTCKAHLVVSQPCVKSFISAVTPWIYIYIYVYICIHIICIHI